MDLVHGGLATELPTESLGPDRRYHKIHLYLSVLAFKAIQGQRVQKHDREDRNSADPILGLLANDLDPVDGRMR
jgi:hypothetical protein